MDSSAALPSGGDPISYESGVSLSCYGIDLIPIGNAPFGKLVRVNVYTDDPDPLALIAFAHSFSEREPFFIGRTEFIAILEDGKESGECFGPVPGNAENLNSHGCLPK